MPVQPLTLAPVVLAAVLLLSAVAKLGDRGSTLSSIVLLRMPRALQAPWVARALPVGEIVLALVMLLSPWSGLTRAAAVAALGLFAVYAAVIARAMTFDPRPSCGCFGRIGDQRVSARTLARNLVFVLLAVVFVAWASVGHTVPAAVADFSAADLLWVVMALMVALVAVFISGGSFGAAIPGGQHPASVAGGSSPVPTSPARDADGEDEEYVRSPIPDVLLITPEGAPVTLRELAAERAQLVVFGNCYCGSTVHAIRQVPEWAQSLPALDVRYVFSGIPPRDDQGQDTSGWVDHGGVVWRALGLTQSPAAVLLGADGMLAGGPVGGIDEVSQLVEDIVATLAEAPPIEFPVPAAEQTVSGQLL